MMMKRTRNQLMSTPMRIPKTRASCMDPPPNTTMDGGRPRPAVPALRRSALLGEALQGHQSGVPLGRHGRHPPGGRLERLRPHGEEHLTALAPALYEAGPIQDREVLDNGRAADRHDRGEGARAALAAGGEPGLDLPPRGVPP